MTVISRAYFRLESKHTFVIFNALQPLVYMKFCIKMEYSMSMMQKHSLD